MEVYGYVYLVRNKVNGKVYIGQTTDSVRGRWVSHQSAARRAGRKPAFINAIRKYGAEGFDVVELGRAFDKDELNAMEIRAIWSHDSTNKAYGYNITLGGEGGKWTDERKVEHSLRVRGSNNGHFGKHHSDEVKQKQSVERSGVSLAPEHAAKVTQALREWQAENPEWIEKHREVMTSGRASHMRSLRKNNSHSEETKQRMSAAKKGVPRPKEAVDKVAAFWRGTTQTEERREITRAAMARPEVRQRMRESSAKRWAAHRASKQAEQLALAGGSHGA